MFFYAFIAPVTMTSSFNSPRNWMKSFRSTFLRKSIQLSDTHNNPPFLFSKVGSIEVWLDKDEDKFNKFIQRRTYLRLGFSNIILVQLKTLLRHKRIRIVWGSNSKVKELNIEGIKIKNKILTFIIIWHSQLN